MSDLEIVGVRASTGSIDIRGRSRDDCPSTAGSAVNVKVTMDGDATIAYEGNYFFTGSEPLVNGRRSWAVIATRTLASIGIAGFRDPPCDLPIRISAIHGAVVNGAITNICSTKATATPIVLRCCAVVAVESADVSADPCNANRTRVVTVRAAIDRRNQPDAIVVEVSLRGPETVPSQTFTLPDTDETRTVTLTFTVPAPAPTTTATYECAIEVLTPNEKCVGQPKNSRPVTVPGCPCAAGPTDQITVHEPTGAFAEIPAETRNGVSCFTRSRVKVMAPAYAADPALSWSANATPVAGERAALVDLPADGSETIVVATIGTSPCATPVTIGLRKCVDVVTVDNPPGPVVAVPPTEEGGPDGVPVGDPARPFWCMFLEAIWMIAFIIALVLGGAMICVVVLGAEAMVGTSYTVAGFWIALGATVMSIEFLSSLFFTFLALALIAFALWVWTCKPSWCRSMGDLAWVYFWGATLSSWLVSCNAAGWYLFFLGLASAALLSWVLIRKCMPPVPFSLPWMRPYDSPMPTGG